MLGISRCGPTNRAMSAEELDTDFMVIVPISGMYIRHVNDEEILASPAVALFVEAGEVSRTSHPQGGADQSLFVSLSPELAGWFTDGYGVSRRRAALDPGAAAMLRLSATTAARGGPLSSLQIEEAVAALAAGWPAASPPRGVREAVQRAEEYLTAHFREDADLRTVARAVGYSPHHLSRMFTRMVGVPLGVYRARLRVAEAMTRLLGGDDDIARVAVESGFYDHAHLVRQTRRMVGWTPSQIRALGSAVDNGGRQV